MPTAALDRVYTTACAATNAARPRRVTEGGRNYLVAPLTLIVPGVLAGSQGPLYYPPAEVARNPRDWDGVPLTVGHPVDPLTGEHLSAGRGHRNAVVGAVRRPGLRGDRLTAEGWFHESATRAHAPELYDALLTGTPVELSTGLFTDNEPAPFGAAYNGRPYTAVARNYRPDHVAVLLGERGACSLDDGCGVNVNTRRTTVPIATNADPTDPLQASEEAAQSTLSAALDGLTGPADPSNLMPTARKASLLAVDHARQGAHRHAAAEHRKAADSHDRAAFAVAQELANDRERAAVGEHTYTPAERAKLSRDVESHLALARLHRHAAALHAGAPVGLTPVSSLEDATVNSYDDTPLPPAPTLNGEPDYALAGDPIPLTGTGYDNYRAQRVPHQRYTGRRGDDLPPGAGQTVGRHRHNADDVYGSPPHMLERRVGRGMSRDDIDAEVRRRLGLSTDYGDDLNLLIPPSSAYPDDQILRPATRAGTRNAGEPCGCEDDDDGRGVYNALHAELAVPPTLIDVLAANRRERCAELRRRQRRREGVR